VGLFPTTQWGLVVAAGGSGHEPDRSALETLCTAYWYPVYVYARHAGRDAEDARDLTQGFFTHLIEKGVLGVADRERGSFRAFLKATFDHYAANERRKDRALKRGAGEAPLPLELETAESRFARDAIAADSPDVAFERHWARTLLAHALTRLESEMSGSGNEHRFRRLSPLLTGTDDGTAYLRLADELDMSESAIKVAVHRMRKRFGALLREEVAQTVRVEARVDTELRHVLEVLGG
jgi:RNA polymerase sigma-70 factor (ECF subfamily)